MENTHEAIISEEVFQKVQELIASRRRETQKRYDTDFRRIDKMCRLRMVFSLWGKQAE